MVVVECCVTLYYIVCAKANEMPVYKVSEMLLFVIAVHLFYSCRPVEI
jgi:hypothetical protein